MRNAKRSAGRVKQHKNVYTEPREKNFEECDTHHVDR